MNNLGNRLKLYCQAKNLKNKDLVPILGMTEQKIGTILNGKYQGSFEEFEEIVSKISNTTDDEYYYSTGKHLPSDTSHTQAPPTPNCTNEIKMLSNTIKDLSHIISHLITEMSDLKSELRSLKGVNESQGLVTHTGSKVKVPDH